MAIRPNAPYTLPHSPSAHILGDAIIVERYAIA